MMKKRLWYFYVRKLARYLDKILELISRYSKINNICDKGEVCHDGRWSDGCRKTLPHSCGL